MVEREFVEKQAGVLVKVITVEMSLGTKYFNKEGRELKSVAEVLNCLSQHGIVEVEPTEERKEIYQMISELQGNEDR